MLSDGYLLTVNKISLVKKLTVEIDFWLKFYLAVLLLMIKISQCVHKNLDSYCEKSYGHPNDAMKPLKCMPVLKISMGLKKLNFAKIYVNVIKQ